MKFKLIMLVLLGLLFGGGSYWMFAVPDVGSREIPRTPASIERGAYLVTAGGCVSCHAGQSEGMEETLAGGLALESDFGTFYAPNITPDPDTGIGNWTGNDFLLAIKHGRTPTGSFYYPAFPYRAYSGLTDRDVLAMAAYLQSLEPVSNSVPEADTPAWLGRWAVAGWNKLADFRQPDQADFDDEQLARGAYLARNLGHCGECHTPRDALGIPDLNREYAGATMGEDTIEAIDADALVDWNTSAFDLFLLLGLKPNDEFVGGEMSDVIEHNTSLLTDEDRMALAIFFTRHNPPE